MLEKFEDFLPKYISVSFEKEGGKFEFIMKEEWYENPDLIDMDTISVIVTQKAAKHIHVSKEELISVIKKFHA